MTIRTNGYINNSESVLENEMLKILRNFEIQTDHLISARQQDEVVVNNNKKKKKKKKEKERERAE